MTELKPLVAEKDAKVLAKKFRITVEEAEAILIEYGDDKKAAEKAARRIAA